MSRLTPEEVIQCCETIKVEPPRSNENITEFKKRANKAYKEMARNIHPDKNLQKSMTGYTQLMQQLNADHDKLQDGDFSCEDVARMERMRKDEINRRENEARAKARAEAEEKARVEAEAKARAEADARAEAELGDDFVIVPKPDSNLMSDLEQTIRPGTGRQRKVQEEIDKDKP